MRAQIFSHRDPPTATPAREYAARTALVNGIAVVAVACASSLGLQDGNAFGDDRVVRTRDEQPARASLYYDGHTLDEWNETMKSIDFTSPSAAEAVPGLLELVRDSQLPWYTRRQAALTLGRIGRPAREAAVPVLARLLDTQTELDAPPTVAWAAKALSLFGSDAAPATPALVQVVSDNDRSHLERLSCVEALARIGGAHGLALPGLIQLAQAETDGSHEAESLREAAVDGLALGGSAAGPAVPTLIRLSREDSWRLRKKAAVALGAIGPAAGIAAPALVELVLFDERSEVRKAAASSLATVGELGEAGLQKLLTDREREVRLFAAEAMGLMERPGTAVTGGLSRTLSDPDNTVRIASAESLWALNREAEPLLPVILDVLTSKDRLLRMRAYRLLMDLGRAAAPASDELSRMAHDPRPYVRQVAEKALSELANMEAGTSVQPTQ